MFLMSTGFCGEFKTQETPVGSHWRKTISGGTHFIAQNNTQICFSSVPLKVVGRDFHWILTFVLTLGFTQVTDHMFVHLMDVIKDLLNPLTSSHICCLMPKLSETKL